VSLKFLGSDRRITPKHGPRPGDRRDKKINIFFSLFSVFNENTHLISNLMSFIDKTLDKMSYVFI
jgi:hypothetical protein